MITSRLQVSHFLSSSVVSHQSTSVCTHLVCLGFYSKDTDSDCASIHSIKTLINMTEAAELKVFTDPLRNHKPKLVNQVVYSWQRSIVLVFTLFPSGKIDHTLDLDSNWLSRSTSIDFLLKNKRIKVFQLGVGPSSWTGEDPSQLHPRHRETATSRNLGWYLVRFKKNKKNKETAWRWLVGVFPEHRELLLVPSSVCFESSSTSARRKQNRWSTIKQTIHGNTNKQTNSFDSPVLINVWFVSPLIDKTPDSGNHHAPKRYLYDLSFPLWMNKTGISLMFWTSPSRRKCSFTVNKVM